VETGPGGASERERAHKMERQRATGRASERDRARQPESESQRGRGRGRVIEGKRGIERERAHLRALVLARDSESKMRRYCHR